MDPRAERRVVAVEDVMAGVELVLGGVVVVRDPDRAHDGQVINAAADARPPVADLNAALAALAVADLQGVNPRHEGARPAGEVADVLAVIRRFEDGLGVGRFVDGLAGVLVEGGFGVEALQVAGAAEHEQPDDRLGLRREVRLGRGRRLSDAVPEEHGAESENNAHFLHNVADALADRFDDRAGRHSGG